MGIHRLRRAGTSAEVFVLAVMALILGAWCLALALFPFASDSPRGLMLGLGLADLTVGALLVLAGPRVSPPTLHATIVLFTAMIGVMVAMAATERGLMLSALVYFWTAVYVAFFFRRQVARIYAAGMIAVLGLSLLAAHAPTDVAVWVTISTMIWVAVSILTQLNDRLRAEAHTDRLTGLLNRTGFALAAARHRAAAERRAEPVSLAIIDLDDFKRVNDRDGHAAGDRLLVGLAAAWTTSLRPGDLLGRFGGDEFVLIVADATEAEVDEILGRFARVHPASWTAGAVTCHAEESLAAAIDRADARLYAAKQRLRRQAPVSVRA